MLRFARIGFLGLSLAAASACGGGSATSAATGMPMGAGAVAPLAAKLGIPESYVAMALQGAQGALGGVTSATPDQKAAAAQAGVDKATAQAQTDGKPLTAEQQTGLLDGIKGML